MTMGRMKDYKGKEGTLPKDERKSTKEMKEVNQGKDGSQLVIQGKEGK